MNLLGAVQKFTRHYVECLKVLLQFLYLIGGLHFYIRFAERLWLLCIEGLLQQLLSLKWTEPALVEVLGHYLDAMGPFLKYFPDAVGRVINKLFELLTSLPFVVEVLCHCLVMLSSIANITF